MTDPRPLVVLMADDDEDDRFLAAEALAEWRVINDFHTVGDGVELLDYLRHRGASAGEPAPRPDLILLDLNMPRMNGYEALDEIKADVDLRSIPVVVLTTSDRPEDIQRVYDIGGSSFIQKPVTVQGMVDVMAALDRYWFQIVELPHP